MRKDNHFGRFVKRMRKDRGLTQEQLAARVNAAVKGTKISGKQQISKWENGTHIPSLSHASGIARALNITVDEMCKAFDLEPGDEWPERHDPLMALPADARQDLVTLLSTEEGRALFDELLRLHQGGNKRLLPAFQHLLHAAFDECG